MPTEGQIIQALTNAVLALYGEPEPRPLDLVTDIAGKLHGLAADRRDASRRGEA